MEHTFRYAEEKDTALILRFIRELAEYEKMSDEVVATEELLKEWIFEKKKAEVIFAMEGEEAVGFALFFHNFSTFLGRAGIYLEDLFVMPEHRGKGYGKALVEFWEAEMKEAGYRTVLTSTASDEYAQHFYQKLGYVAIGGFMLPGDPYEIILSKKLN